MQIAHAVFAGFGGFFAAAKFGFVVDFAHKILGPLARGKGWPARNAARWRSIKVDESRERLARFGDEILLAHPGWLMAAKTEQPRSWLAARRRSMVTSLKPRAGTLAMRSRLMSSCGLMNVLR